MNHVPILTAFSQNQSVKWESITSSFFSLEDFVRLQDFYFICLFSEWWSGYCWMPTLSGRATLGILPRTIYL